MKSRLFLVVFSLLFCDNSANKFDFIVVGGGTAGSIVASKMALDQSTSTKKILVLERGGPLSVLIGGSEFPPYSNERTIFDVPGEYGNIPFKSKGQPFTLETTPFTFQGTGLGGNALFNGMLWQRLPDQYFDDKYPSEWKAEDILPYYEDLESRMRITETPSTDGVHELDETVQLSQHMFEVAGIDRVSLKVINYTAGWGIPPVAVTEDGFRDGPAQLYLKDLLDDQGNSLQENLVIRYFADVTKILLSPDDGSTAIGVEYIQYPDLQSANLKKYGVPSTASLPASSGHIVMSAGALATPRLLMLSGIKNDGIGQIVDKVGIAMVVSVQGETSYKAFRPGDYDANEAELDMYNQNRTGPYMQYEPVLMVQRVLGSSDFPNVEMFYNPMGLGQKGGIFNRDNMFSVFVTLLDPKSRGDLVLDDNDLVAYPGGAYFGVDEDIQLLAETVVLLLQSINSEDKFKVVLGPGGVGDENLDPTNVNDVRAYVTTDVANADTRVHKGRLILNHWSNSCPLRINADSSCVDPTNLRVRGTTNVHVVDASLLADSPPGHPVATVMAFAEKAADILLLVDENTSEQSTRFTKRVTIIIIVVCVVAFLLAVYMLYKLFWVRLNRHIEIQKTMPLHDKYVNMDIVETADSDRESILSDMSS